MTSTGPPVRKFSIADDVYICAYIQKKTTSAPRKMLLCEKTCVIHEYCLDLESIVEHYAPGNQGIERSIE